ncbi:hypothetical protein FQA39_LY00300 [Lamprigera yunnana]|nr:hypothetical protein FQA39_LY00300 [Lamprigera yunnana]
MPRNWKKYSITPCQSLLIRNENEETRDEPSILQRYDYKDVSEFLGNKNKIRYLTKMIINLILQGVWYFVQQSQEILEFLGFT